MQFCFVFNFKLISSKFLNCSLLFGPTNFRHGVGVSTGQESPETRRRMLGHRKCDSTLTSPSTTITVKSPQRAPLSDGLTSVNETSSPHLLLRKRDENDLKDGKENRAKSPSRLPACGYPLASASPHSSPSRSDGSILFLLMMPSLYLLLLWWWLL